MKLDDATLKRVFDRSSGKCHICHKQLAFKNYNQPSARGAWHVEHSKPRARGGSDCLNNLFPAHIRCNIAKGVATSRTARKAHGLTRAPLSAKARRAAKLENGLVGGALGMVVGAFAGPAGVLFGGLFGSRFGYDQDPDRG
jgi:5-methylcytosine-specific restriction endonuclease McrA